MLVHEQMNTVTTNANPFRRLVAEHYLRRAEECLQMARYNAARKTLKRVLAIDPGSRSAQFVQRRIDQALEEVRGKHEGIPENGNGAHKGNGKSGVKKFRRGEIVLVVDQDERVLTALTASLRKYGFGAIGASGYDEAREAVAMAMPDLIVSEVNFENGPAGFDLYLWVRNNADSRRIPFLYLATQVHREMLIAGKRFGVDDIIAKPFDAEVVMASIVNCLSRRRQKQVNT